MPQIIVPDIYRCPITGFLIKEPIYIFSENNSICYEKSALEEWYSKHKTHPLTKQPLSSLLFLKSEQKKKEIEDFLNANLVCSEEEFLNVFLVGNIEELEQLNYLDTYFLLQYEGQSLLHIAIELENLALVQLILKIDIRQVNLKSAQGISPIEKALHFNNFDIVQALVLHGSEHPVFTFKKWIKILDAYPCARLIVYEEEFNGLLDALRFNTTLKTLTLKTFPLKQDHIDALQSIFDDNSTLTDVNINSSIRSYNNFIQPLIKKNIQSNSLVDYKNKLIKLGISLPDFFSNPDWLNDRETEAVQIKTKELLEFLAFKFSSNEITPEEKKIRDDWIIYFLALEVPCRTYLDMLDRALESRLKFSFSDLNPLSPGLLVWSEKFFKTLYLAIQEEYGDFFKDKIIKPHRMKKKLTPKNYAWCINNIINLLNSEYDLNFIKDLIGPSRKKMLKQGVIPLLLELKQKNTNDFFSKRLNILRATIEANTLGLMFKDGDHNILSTELQKLSHIRQWREKYGICSKQDFLWHIRVGDLKEIKELNYLDCYLFHNKYKYSPMYIAASLGHWDVVMWLAKKGVDLEIDLSEKKKKERPLAWAFYYGNLEMAQWIMDQQMMDYLKLSNSTFEQLTLAAGRNEQLEALDFLLKKEYERFLNKNVKFKSKFINSRDHFDNTLLHICIKEYKSVHWISQLVERGLDLKLINGAGESGLHIAALMGHHEALSYLIKQGCLLEGKYFIYNPLFDYAYANHQLQTQVSDSVIVLVLSGLSHPGLAQEHFVEILKKAKGEIRLTLNLQVEFDLLVKWLPSLNQITHICIRFTNWNDENRDKFITAIQNSSLESITVLGDEMYSQEMWENINFLLKIKKIFTEVSCFEFYKPYFGGLSTIFESPFKLGNLKEETSEMVERLIHLIAFGDLDYQASYEILEERYKWIIYLLYNVPLQNGILPINYFNLLKIAFLFLLNKTKLEQYANNNEYDDLISKKDLWVWTQEDVIDACVSFKFGRDFKIELDMPISKEVYDSLLQQIINLLKNEENPLVDVKSRQGKFKNQDMIALLKLGFKPLYLEYKKKNAEIIFSDELNQWRAAFWRHQLTEIALEKAEKFIWLNWDINERSLAVKQLRKKYDFYLVKEFWKKFQDDPWATLSSPNYFTFYLSCSDSEGNTLAHVAVKKINLDLLNCLLEMGASLDQANIYGLTPMHLALELNRIDIFNFIFDKVLIPEQLKSELIHFAFMNSSWKTVATLLEYGFKLDWKSKDEYGNSLIYKALLHNGKDNIIQYFNHFKIEIIDDLPIDEQAIFLAIKRGHIEIIQFFVENNYSLNFKDPHGLTPLHYAIQLGSINLFLNIAKLLIQGGCPINEKDVFGKTPLSYAKNLLKLNPESTFCHFLIQNGAQHDPLNEIELRFILSDIKKAKLYIVSQEELAALVNLLKENLLPKLIHLEIYFFNKKVPKLNQLFTWLQNNKSLLQFSFFINDEDVSKFFNKIIEKNICIKNWEPYRKELAHIYIDDNIFSLSKLSRYSVQDVLVETIKTKILLPLDKLKNKFANGLEIECYQWLLELLVAQKELGNKINLLHGEVFQKILQSQKTKNNSDVNEFILFSTPEVATKASKVIHQYQKLMELYQIAICLKHFFPNLNMYARLKSIYLKPNFFHNSIDDYLALIPTLEWIFYKIALVSSYESYWKNKNNNKLNTGMKEFHEVFLKAFDVSGNIHIRQCLIQLKEIAIEHIKKTYNVTVFKFQFFSIDRNYDVIKLYEYLADLNLDDLNPNTIILDEILRKIWKEREEFPENSEEMLRIYNKEFND